MAINTKPDLHEYVVCANCFVRKGDKFLVLRRSAQKRWAPDVIHPIGGKVEIGENPYAAAMRELEEEAGVQVKNVRLEAVFLEIEPHLDEPYNWLIFHFSGDYKSGGIKNTEEGELLWLSTKQIKNEKLFPSVKVAIEYILSKKHGTIFATFEYDGKKEKIIKNSYSFCSR